MKTTDLINGMEASYRRCLEKLREDDCSFIEMLFIECLNTARKKNADYAGEIDAFGNFMEIEKIAPHISAESGIIVRISDKIKRVSNLLNKPPAVIDESIADTVQDAINYLAILLELRRSRSTE